METENVQSAAGEGQKDADELLREIIQIDEKTKSQYQPESKRLEAEKNQAAGAVAAPKPAPSLIPAESEADAEAKRIYEEIAASAAKVSPQEPKPQQAAKKPLFSFEKGALNINTEEPEPKESGQKTYIQQIIETGYQNLTPVMKDILKEERNPENLKEISEKMPAYEMSDEQYGLLFEKDRSNNFNDLKNVITDFATSIPEILKRGGAELGKFGTGILNLIPDSASRGYIKRDSAGKAVLGPDGKPVREVDKLAEKQALGTLGAAPHAIANTGYSLFSVAAKNIKLGNYYLDLLKETVGLQDKSESQEKFVARKKLEAASARQDIESPSAIEKMVKSDEARKVTKAVLSLNSPSPSELLATDLVGTFGGDLAKAKAFRDEQLERNATQIVSDVSSQIESTYDPEMVGGAGWIVPYGNEFSAVMGGVGALNGAVKAFAKMKAGRLTAEEANALARVEQAALKQKAVAAQQKASEVGVVGTVSEKAANAIDASVKSFNDLLESLPESMKPYVGKALGFGTLGGLATWAATSEDAPKKLVASLALLAAPRVASDLAKARAAAGGGIRGTFQAASTMPEMSMPTKLMLSGINPKLADWTVNKGVELAKRGVHAGVLATALGIARDETPDQLGRGIAEAFLMGEAYNLLHGGVGTGFRAVAGKGIVNRARTIDQYNRERNQQISALNAMTPESRETTQNVTSFDRVIEQAEAAVNRTQERLADLESAPEQSDELNAAIQERRDELQKRQAALEQLKRADAETRMAYEHEVLNAITNADVLVNGALTPQKNVKIEILTTEQIKNRLRSLNPNASEEEIETIASQKGFSLESGGMVPAADGTPIGRRRSDIIFDPFKNAVVVNADKIMRRLKYGKSADESILDVLGHEIGHALGKTTEYQRLTESLRNELFGRKLTAPDGTEIHAEEGIYKPSDLLALMNVYFNQSGDKSEAEVQELKKAAGILDKNGNLNVERALEYMQEEIVADMVGLSSGDVALRQSGLMESILDWVKTKTKNKLVNNVVDSLSAEVAPTEGTGVGTGIRFLPDQLKRSRAALKTLADLDGWLTQLEGKPKRTLTKSEVMANRALFNHYYKDSGAVQTKMVGEVVDGNGNVVERIILPDSSKTGEWTIGKDENGNTAPVKVSGFGELPAELSGKEIPENGKLIIRSDVVVDANGKPVEVKGVREILKHRSDLIRAALENAPDAQSADAMRARSKDGLMFRGKLTPAQRRNIENLPELIVPYSIKLKLFALNDAMAKNDGTRMLAEYAARLSDSGKYVDFSPTIIDFVPIGFQFSKAGNFLVTTVSVSGLNRKFDLMMKQMPSRFSLWNYDKAEFMGEFVNSYLANLAAGRNGEMGLSEDPQTALNKKNIFNDFVNAFDLSTEDANPDRTELQPRDLTKEEKKEWKRSDPNTVIRARRLDSLTDVIESNQMKMPFDYGKLKINFLPEQQDAEERPEPLGIKGERITDATYVRPDGTIRLGATHLEANPDASKDPEERDSERYGFMTNNGRVVSRAEAYDIAKEAGQIIEEAPDQKLRSSNVDLQSERSGPDVAFLPSGESALPSAEERANVRRAAPQYVVAAKRVKQDGRFQNEVTIRNENGDDVGTAVYNIDEQNPTRANVIYAAVSPEFRNQGYGPVLYAELASAASGDGAQTLYSDPATPQAIRTRPAPKVRAQEAPVEPSFVAENNVGKPPENLDRIVGANGTATGLGLQFLPLSTKHWSPNEFETPNVRYRGGRQFGLMHGWGLYTSAVEGVPETYRASYGQQATIVPDAKNESGEQTFKVIIPAIANKDGRVFAKGLKEQDATELLDKVVNSSGFMYKFEIANPESFADAYLNVFAQPKEVQKGLNRFVDLLPLETKDVQSDSGWSARNRAEIEAQLDRIISDIDDPSTEQANRFKSVSQNAMDEAQYYARRAYKIDSSEAALEFYRIFGNSIGEIFPYLNIPSFKSKNDLLRQAVSTIYNNGTQAVDSINENVKKGIASGFFGQSEMPKAERLVREKDEMSPEEYVSRLMDTLGVGGMMYPVSFGGKQGNNYVVFNPEGLKLLSRSGSFNIAEALGEKGYQAGINFLPSTEKTEEKRFAKTEDALAGVPRRATPEQIVKMLTQSGITEQEIKLRGINAAMADATDAEGYVSRDALVSAMQNDRQRELQNASAVQVYESSQAPSFKASITDSNGEQVLIRVEDNGNASVIRSVEPESLETPTSANIVRNEDGKFVVLDERNKPLLLKRNELLLDGQQNAFEFASEQEARRTLATLETARADEAGVPSERAVGVPEFKVALNAAIRDGNKAIEWSSAESPSAIDAYLAQWGGRAEPTAEGWRVELPDQLLKDAERFGTVQFLPERSVAVVPERFFGSETDNRLDVRTGKIRRFAGRPSWTEKFNVTEYVAGGRFFDSVTGEDITNRPVASTGISVSDGKPKMTAVDDVLPSTANLGNIRRSNLFKKNAGWEWTSENPPKTETLISVEGSGLFKDRDDKHAYTLDLTFENGAVLQSYPAKPNEPRLRPTGNGDVVFGPEVGRIKTSGGKEHPVYGWARVVAPERTGAQFLPEDVSRRDEEYRKAVETNDTKTAGRLIEEAAKAAGIPAVGFNVNDSEQPFTEQILSGEKTIETRDGENNALASLVGERAGIVRTGKGKAKVVGYVTVGEPIRYETKADFDADFNKHLVDGGEYGFKGFKIGYPMLDVERIEEYDAPAAAGVIKTRPIHDPVIYNDEGNVVPPSERFGAQFLPSVTTDINKSDTEQYSIVLGAKAGEFGFKANRLAQMHKNDELFRFSSKALDLSKAVKSALTKEKDAQKKLDKAIEDNDQEAIQSNSKKIGEAREKWRTSQKGLIDTIADRSVALAQAANLERQKAEPDAKAIERYEAENEDLTKYLDNVVFSVDASFVPQDDIGKLVTKKMTPQFKEQYERGLIPPPFSLPIKNVSQEDISRDVKKIFNSTKFRGFLIDYFGKTIGEKIQVIPSHGTWQGQSEQNIILRLPENTQRTPELDEQVMKLGDALGFALAQDARIVYLPRATTGEKTSKESTQYYVYSPTPIPQKKAREIMRKAKNWQVDEGGGKTSTIDWTFIPTGEGFKLMYFGDNQAGFEAKLEDLRQLIDPNSALIEESPVYSDYNETTSAFAKAGAGTAEKSLSETVGNQPLFQRLLDSVFIPYAKAVTKAGYEFRFKDWQKRFGLSDPTVESVINALYPKSGLDISTRELFESPDLLGAKPTLDKNGNLVYKLSVNEMIEKLESRTQRAGVISPTDRSDKALKILSTAIADEVEGQVERAKKGGAAMTAVGWYSTVIDKMKKQYAYPIIAELGQMNKFRFLDKDSAEYDKEKALIFDIVLGSTSQGNNVFENAKMAVRVMMMYLNGSTLSNAVKDLQGSFGDKTVAIEENIRKAEHLLKNVGAEELGKVFNQTKTIREWEDIFKNDKRFRWKNEPLELTGSKDQEVTGFFVFGPKIGSFINNLHGNYDTLTADLWYSRTWNRLLGRAFKYDPATLEKQYKRLDDEMTRLWESGEYTKNLTDLDNNLKAAKKLLAKLKAEGGTTKKQQDALEEAKEEVSSLTAQLDALPKLKDQKDFDALISSPETMIGVAAELYKVFKTGGFKQKTVLNKAAKNLSESLTMPIAAPRGSTERVFQTKVVREAQRLLKEKGLDLTIADIQASLWFNEKELFALYGAAGGGAKQADYSHGALAALYAMASGTLYEVNRKVAGTKKVEKYRLLDEAREKAITGVESPNKSLQMTIEQLREKLGLGKEEEAAPEEDEEEDEE